MSENNISNENALTGKKFISFSKDKRAKWQGEILSEVSPGYFMVQAIDVLTQKLIRIVVNIKSMGSWQFFNTNDEMLKMKNEYLMN